LFFCPLRGKEISSQGDGGFPKGRFSVTAIQTFSFEKIKKRKKNKKLSFFIFFPSFSFIHKNVQSTHLVPEF